MKGFCQRNETSVLVFRALGNAVAPQQVYPILKAIADDLRVAA